MVRLHIPRLYYLLFFFKQKTAYEMRISDWSSDVCSSDVPNLRRPGGADVHRRLVGFRSLRRLFLPDPGSTLRSDDRQCDGRLSADVIRGREWYRCARCAGGSRHSPENPAERVWASVAALLVVLRASPPTVSQLHVR